MTMKSSLLAGVAALLVVGLLISTQVASQEKEAQPPSGEKQMCEEMAKWARFNAPGPQHKEFAKAVGRWDVVSRWWMAPGAEPTESKGTAEFKPLFDGRYMTQEYKCAWPAMPFEGLGIEGYDNFKKKYVSVWVDSMSTAIYTMEGTADESGNVITYHGKMDDPMTGEKDKPVRSVLRWISDDKYEFDMYETRHGKEFKMAEMVYTRAK